MKTNQYARIISMVALCALFVGFPLAAAEVKVSIAVTGVEAAKGQVYLAVYNSEEGYKKNKPFKAAGLPSIAGTVTFTLDIPEGEYVFSTYLDANGNQKLDANLIGMPKEPVGLSNYTGGIPGGFDKLKVKISPAENTVTINLKKL